jgi:hypothetical protein
MPGYVKPPVNGRVNGTMEMIPSLATQTPLTIKGAVSQTANLLNIQNSAGTSLITVDSSGRQFLPNQPKFWANRNAGTLGTAGSYTQMVFNSVYVNIGNHYNVSNGTFTAPVSGTYLFKTQCQKRNAGGLQLAFYKNGVGFRGVYSDLGGDSPGPGFSWMTTMAANDTISVYYTLSAGDIYAGGDLFTYFEGQFLG